MKDLQRIPGHARITTTTRYVGEGIAGDRKRLGDVPATLDLHRIHVQVEEGGRR